MLETRSHDIRGEHQVSSKTKFAQSNFAAHRLVGLSAALNAAAPILWGRYGSLPVTPLSLTAEIILADPQRQPSANE
jgi:hypothetical protein